MNANGQFEPIRNIDVALARAFVAIAESGGMTSAARQLNLTQGAVSQQIKRLEDLLGKQLFEREGRRLRLTADGERLLLHARRLIALNDEIWGLMRAPEFEGEVRLGVPHDIVRPFVPPILRSFNDAWPNVRISLICRTSPRLRQALAEGEIDLTLTTETETPAGARHLLTDDLVWLACKGGVAIRANPLPIAITHETCTFRAAMIEALEGAGRDWRFVGPMGNNDALYATVEADLAITALLRSTVPDRIEILDEAEHGLPALRPFHINLYLPTSHTNDAAAELAEHIRTHIGRRMPAHRPERLIA